MAPGTCPADGRAAHRAGGGAAGGRRRGGGGRDRGGSGHRRAARHRQAGLRPRHQPLRDDLLRALPRREEAQGRLHLRERAEGPLRGRLPAAVEAGGHQDPRPGHAAGERREATRRPRARGDRRVGGQPQAPQPEGPRHLRHPPAVQGRVRQLAPRPLRRRPAGREGPAGRGLRRRLHQHRLVAADGGVPAGRRRGAGPGHRRARRAAHRAPAAPVRRRPGRARRPPRARRAPSPRRWRGAPTAARRAPPSWTCC